MYDSLLPSVRGLQVKTVELTSSSSRISQRRDRHIRSVGGVTSDDAEPYSAFTASFPQLVYFEQ
jgi:hypothetical protein